jgi:hypothetical protein
MTAVAIEVIPTACALATSCVYRSSRYIEDKLSCRTAKAPKLTENPNNNKWLGVKSGSTTFVMKASKFSGSRLPVALLPASTVIPKLAATKRTVQMATPIFRNRSMKIKTGSGGAWMISKSSPVRPISSFTSTSSVAQWVVVASDTLPAVLLVYEDHIFRNP